MKRADTDVRNRMENTNVAHTERSLVIIKPDAVQRGLIGQVIARYEARGLKIAAMKFEQVSRETAEKHYGEHKGKPFYEGLVSYITSAPSVLMVVEGPDAIAVVRTTNGATKPAEAAPGTIRGDFALTIGRNVVHASDSVESAEREVGIFFGDGGIVEYGREIDGWVIED
jgi:nucleoside-diphosphate kinase